MKEALPRHAIQFDAKQRTDLLRQLDLLHPAGEADFDELVELAAAICGKPLSAMTLLDEATQWMKARVGFTGSPTMPVRESICQHTIAGDRLLMVEDTENDPRFSGRTILPEDGGVRFYAGVPLLSESGCALGALCVMDVKPSTLSAEQQRALEILAHQISARIQMRERTLALERMALERERAERMFDAVLNHIPVGIYLKDSEGRIRFYNQSIAERFHIGLQDWIGKTSYDLWDHATAERLMEEERFVIASGEAQVSTVTLPTPDGSTSFWKSYKVPCENADGEQLLACCSFDLTAEVRRENELQTMQAELKEANHKLSSLALTDSLTGLWNRRAFDARLETGVIAAQRSRQPMALMLVDADHFKRVNDEFGHPYGDTVLKQIASILNGIKRADEIACRFGGEEFAVLLPGSHIDSARALAERLLQAVRAFPWERGAVTVSIGLAMCTDATTADDLVDAADAALYEAKRSGRDRLVMKAGEEEAKAAERAS